MQKQIERWYPLGLAAIAATLYYLAFKDRPTPSYLNLLFSLTAVWSGMLAITVSKAVGTMPSMDDSRIVRQLKNASVYDRFISYFDSALRGSVVLLVFNLVAFVTNLAFPAFFQSVALVTMTVWMFVFTEFMLSTYRALHLYTLIAKLAKEIIDVTNRR